MASELGYVQQVWKAHAVTRDSKITVDVAPTHAASSICKWLASVGLLIVALGGAATTLLLLRLHDAPLGKWEFYPVKAPLAACLDGSPPGYYKRWTRHASDKLIVYLEGGGWCLSVDECAARSTTRLGTTRFDAPYVDEFPGILRSSLKFADWQAVYFRYCDGGSFTGGKNDTLSGLHFKGRHNLEAMMASTLEQFEDVTDVLFIGCSAGGMALAIHCDRLAEVARSKWREARVDCLNDAGFFPLLDFSFLGVMEPRAALSVDCLKHHSWHECLHASYATRYSRTRTLIVNDIFNWISDQSAESYKDAVVEAVRYAIDGRREISWVATSTAAHAQTLVDVSTVWPWIERWYFQKEDFVRWV